MTASPTIRPFVVTGCGRSGTAYASEVLMRLGFRVGHEVVFGPRTERFDGFGHAHGDSSWLAPPFLDQLPDGSVVVHQVRHPLAVARSFVGIRFFEHRQPASLAVGVAYTHAKWQARRVLMALDEVPPSTKGPRPHLYYQRFVQRHAPDVYAERTPVERALRYWVTWNRLVARAQRLPTCTYLRRRVEDFDVAMLGELVERLGIPISDSHAAMVLDSVPRNTNTMRPATFSWDDVPEGQAKRDSALMAEEYGYDPTTASPRPWIPGRRPTTGARP